MRFFAILLLMFAYLLPGTPALAAGHRASQHPPKRPSLPPPPGLQVRATPGLADVGSSVLLSVSATAWPGPASVRLTFVAPHHGFSGAAPWRPSCQCFQVAVFLASRIHPLEMAHAKAIVRTRQGVYTVATSFQIRGLAPNGRDFAPGGAAVLTGWVSDPTPVAGEYQHYCGQMKTVDGLGIPGKMVTVVVSYVSHKEHWVMGPTNADGIACRHRQLAHPKAGVRVYVDLYAQNHHVRTSFTPHR